MDKRFRTEIHLSLVLRLEKSFSQTELRHGYICSSLQLQDSFQDCDDFLLRSKNCTR